VKAKLPFCDEYLITTFFRPRSASRARACTAHPAPRDPRGEAHARRPPARLPDRRGQRHALDTLRATGLECRVYGMRRGIIEEDAGRGQPHATGPSARRASSTTSRRPGRHRRRRASPSWARPCTSTSPCSRCPLGGQFEQVLNARYLMSAPASPAGRARRHASRMSHERAACASSSSAIFAKARARRASDARLA
jgi:hypothetical protein